MPTTVPTSMISLCYWRILDHLQKSQGENEAILAKQIDFSSEDYKNAVKEQTYIQNSAKQLTILEKAYKTEVNQLKSSLQNFREEKASVPKNIIKELQRNIENSIKGLKQSVFSLDAVYFILII
jgi:predicted  nucleic acid-binding Zn-ribbon protein